MPRKKKKSSSSGSSNPTPNKSTSSGSGGGAAAATPTTAAPTKKAPAKAKAPPEPPAYNPNAINSGSASAVFLILFILFVIVAWKDLISKMLNAIWDPKAQVDISKLPWSRWAGAMVFILAATLLANTSDEMAGLMLLIAISIALVYLVENKGGGLTQFLDMLSKNAQK